MDNQDVFELFGHNVPYELLGNEERRMIAKMVKGDLVLKEHKAAKWLRKEQLADLDWLPADITLIDIIMKSRG